MYQGNSINEEFQTAMEDLFYKYGVDIYFSGHVHSYERDYPVYKGVTEPTYNNPRATTYVMIGGAGNDEMHDAEMKKPQEILTSSEKARRDTANEGLGKWRKSEENGQWTVVTDNQYLGVGSVTIKNANELEFTYYRTTSGEVFDTFSLARNHDTPYGI